MFLMLLLCLIVFWSIVWQWSRRRKLPPGPVPFLFLGNAPQLLYGSVVYGGLVETMREWERQYGTVYTMWIGPLAMVNICDYGTSLDVMVKQGANHVGRYAPDVWTRQKRDKNGVVRGTIFSSDEMWQEHRRFSLRTLRNFGLGRNVMESTIMEEFDYACAMLDKQMENDQLSIPTNEFFDMLTGSIINRMLFGYRFNKKNKERFFAVKWRLDVLFDESHILDFLMGPWWDKVPLLSRRSKHLQEPQIDVFNFIWENIERRKYDIASGERHLEGDGADFLDAYFIEKQTRDAEGKSHSFDEFGLSVDLFDLWIAGQETTSITLCWGFIFLLLHPEVVEKCRKEIFSITNRNRNVSLTDRAAMPYVNATITEIQRLASIFNLNLFRINSEPTECGGYTITPNTIITAQLSLIMSDEGVFRDPYKFFPERYTMTGDKSIEQAVIPFGIGKRSCLGESLAKAELFLVISNLIQRYDLSIDPSNPPSMSPANPKQIMRRPKPYKIILTST